MAIFIFLMENTVKENHKFSWFVSLYDKHFAKVENIHNKQRLRCSFMC